MFIITVIPFGVAIVNYLVSRIIRMHQFHKISFFHIFSLKGYETQTFLQRGTPSARLIFNSMFVVVAFYCVTFFLKWTFSKIIVSFPFPFRTLFWFYFLSSILLEFSWIFDMSNFQNIGCLMKTKKNSTQTFFSRGWPMSRIDLQ